MKILITGAEGQLGRAVSHALAGRGIEFQGFGHRELDVTDAELVRKTVREYRPGAVVHCASYNRVDMAEDEPEVCAATNVEGTGNVAGACREIGAYMLYISSDYVFDGKKDAPYETEDEKLPLNVYGRSKADGEDITLRIDPENAVLRTSWLYGESRNNFVNAIIRAASSNKAIRVVDDQTGSPTYTEDLAKLIAEMVLGRHPGVYHGTNRGVCSRAELAERIIALAGLRCKVQRVSSEEYASRAIRPANSVLSNKRLAEAGLFQLPEWDDALRRFMNQRKGGM